ncbi:hypothetical protein [Nannocystis pusilla]|uniref:Lipoprotein n=1 Tax=Nannocystis pusilla TaxID=889268 RepID=A0ABS7TK52_9BACT|nr:hypothetical protein [Nannocystis pusilla]MBZ5708613.1 hypothetical protein [Nannocystis pusilla]
MSLGVSILSFLLLEPTAASGEIPAPTPPCGVALSRLLDSAMSHGYSVDMDGQALSGTKGTARFKARCTDHHVALEFAEAAGGTLHINFNHENGRAILELVGRYPEIGTVSRVSIVDDFGAEPLTGSTLFAAETPSESAFVELDLSGAVVAESGDARLLNAEFEPVLSTSTGWSDAHVLMFALAGTTGGTEAQSMAKLMLTAVVPDPRGTKSILAMGAACGTSAVTCTLAATWFPTLAPPCVKESVICGDMIVTAVGCAVFSCED